MKKLKVYGWCGHRLECPEYHKQTREIVAAPSMAAAARAAGKNNARQLWNCCETGNAQEIKVAMKEPGVVFWCGINDYQKKFRRSNAEVNRDAD